MVSAMPLASFPTPRRLFTLFHPPPPTFAGTMPYAGPGRQARRPRPSFVGAAIAKGKRVIGVVPHPLLRSTASKILVTRPLHCARPLSPHLGHLCGCLVAYTCGGQGDGTAHPPSFYERVGNVGAILGHMLRVREPLFAERQGPPKSHAVQGAHPHKFPPHLPHTPLDRSTTSPGHIWRWAAARGSRAEEQQKRGAAIPMGAPSITSTPKNASCASTPRPTWGWGCDGGRA